MKGVFLAAGGFFVLLASGRALAGDPVASTQPAVQASSSSTWTPPIMLGALSDMDITSVRAFSTFGVLPLNAPPINGFVPQVVFGLTDQQAPTDFTFAAHPSSSPGGNTLPKSQAAKYDIAIFDSGSQSHLITAFDFSSAFFNVAGASRNGVTNGAQIAGASGVENVDITDGLGIYATGFANANVSNGTTLGITPGTLKGQWNTAILAAHSDSALPNIFGAPIIAQYQTVIRNSQTQHLTVNGTTYRTPNVSFQALDTSIPSNYYRLTLDVKTANGVSPDPVFIPDLAGTLQNVANNPSTPTFWGSMLATAQASGPQGSTGNQDFLFDTGAQVTVVSQDTAAACGFYSGGENPTTPDFTVAVAGVGGTTVQVPGFYLNTISVLTNGGPITWTHVPVIVLDIPDPRDAVGFIPGVLGMNLFTDRDLILNGGLSNPFVAISPAIAPKWLSSGGGNWSDDTKWSLGAPDNADTAANFLSTITSPSTITVDSVGFTVGSMKFDNANRYTIAGPGQITFAAQSIGQAAIEVVSGSHTISAPIDLQSDTNITVTPNGNGVRALTISNGVDSSNGSAVNKLGPGTLETKHIRAGHLTIGDGTVYVTPNGTSTGTSKITGLSIISALVSPKFDLTNNKLIIDPETPSSALAEVRAEITDGRLTSSLSDSTHHLGYADNSALHLATYGGLDVDTSSILVGFTFEGDANLDGMVDNKDLALLATGWQSGTGYWINGDFNYDGKVNVGDLSLLAMNWMAGTANGPALAQALDSFGLPATAVPEPTTAAALLAILLALAVRARKPVPARVRA